jgi:hypothetical protein
MSSSQQSEYEHSTAEWEAQREIFTYYYVTEDKPLWEVKEIMENSYGFRATFVNLPLQTFIFRKDNANKNQRTTIQTTHNSMES